jgi:hypothetical protein
MYFGPISPCFQKSQMRGNKMQSGHGAGATNNQSFELGSHAGGIGGCGFRIPCWCDANALLGDFHQGYDLPPSGSIAAMTLWTNCRHGPRRRHSCRGGTSSGEFLPDGNSNNTMGIVTRTGAAFTQTGTNYCCRLRTQTSNGQDLFTFFHVSQHPLSP